ncbi:MAG TPA: hypothetical protein VGR57_05205 [Ktedonobacterales bacterium]|nr:hypothetical protein [Ktedonobacterales bacterium]
MGTRTRSRAAGGGAGQGQVAAEVGREESAQADFVAQPVDAVSTAGPLAPGVTRIGYAPIVRVDEERREIELCATSEALDTYGTIFAYEASRDAFARWQGNVREMHERRAVGRRVDVRCDDAARKIFVRLRISAGAEDTWQKVRDGTLRGASIGASNVRWRHERRGERDVPVAQAYDLVELSLVDLPSNPDAQGVTFVRDGVPVLELLDPLDGAYQPPLPLEGMEWESSPPDPLSVRGEGEYGAGTGWSAGEGGPAHATDRAGDSGRARAQAQVPAGYANSLAPLSPQAGSPTGGEGLGVRTPPRAERLAALGAPGYAGYVTRWDGALPDYAGDAAIPDDARALGAYSTNPDGPPDTGVPARAEERPTAATYGQAPEGNQTEVLHRAARSILLGCGCALCQAALALLDPADPAAPDTGRAAEAALVTRALAAQTQRLDDALGGVRASVGAVATTLERVERRVAAIEAQPLPGGPHLRVAEKTNALRPEGGAVAVAEQLRALEGLAGRLSDPQAQLAVATEMIRLQQAAAGYSPALQAMPRAGSGGRAG